MTEREKAAGLRTQGNPSGLIVPLVIDDGDQFPPEIQAIQSEKIHDFANPFMRPDSPKQEALAEVIRTRVCPSIERMLQEAPKFDPTWETVAHQKFRDTFRIQLEEQLTVPSLSLPRARSVASLAFILKRWRRPDVGNGQCGGTTCEATQKHLLMDWDLEAPGLDRFSAY